MPSQKGPSSAQFLRMATRLSKTGHENRFVQGFSDYGLAADIPLSFANVGLKEQHPYLSLNDIVNCLDQKDKLHILFQGNGWHEFGQFWGKWKLLQPKHPIYEVHTGHEGNCIPIAIHCDEGTTLKKKSMMIIQIHPLMGRGTRKRKSSAEEPGCNMLGNSITTRMLWSVMLSRVYSSKKHKGKPLKKLIDLLSQELHDAFFTGFKLNNGRRIFMIPICMKGDWPALAKVGSLSRHFGRQVRSTGKEGGHGICHLCQADRPSFENWHDLSWENMCRMHLNSPVPWTTEPSLVKTIPLPENYKADFFRIDIFHALHKGLMGDIAANAIASGPVF